MRLNSLAILLLLLASFFVHFLQGTFYSAEGPLGALCLGVVLIIELGCVVWLFLTGEHSPSIVLSQLFFFMLLLTFLLSAPTVWGTLYEAIGEVSTQNQFKNSACFCLMLPTTYLLCRNKAIHPRWYLPFCLALLFIAIVQFFYYQRQMLMTQGIEDDLTNSAAYWFVYLLPFFPLLGKRHPWVAAFIFIIALVFILTGAKRGAIICMGATLLFSLFYYLKHQPFRMSRLLVLATAAAAIAALSAYIYTSDEYLQKRLSTVESMEMGAREIAYQQLLQHWQTDSNPVTVLLGNGTAQSITIWGNYAHNDWLELLIDNGVVGVLLYAALLVGIFIQLLRTPLPFTERWAGFLCLIIWTFQSVFSMGYTSLGLSMLPGLLGLLLAPRPEIQE